MKLVLASDHGGYDLKEEIKKHLEGKGYEIEDIGTYNKDSVDYPKYGRAAAEMVAAGKADKGILCCGTGIGISLAANKVKGIRCAVVSDTFSAKMSRAHNDANMLSLGGRVVGAGLALEIVDIWLATEFEGGRHERRVLQIEE
ncbi:MAG: ribose 5-phosphate isomerase B [Firmicutes bacterium]|nr:ribose 5-phosphate isomerase B [Clostridiales bacterium]MBQ4339638.1 ribose 5-phosphate isomerase B [Bacillota bacterium]MBR6700729.1 ribose 5-phosphate isomerase B [Bacillota bacterium]